MATTDLLATSNTDTIQSDGSATYSVVRTGNSLGLTGGANDMRVGQWVVAGPEQIVWQGLVEWDVSSLSGQTVDAATLSLSPTSGDDSATDLEIRVRPHPYGTVAAADFVAGASLASTGSLLAHYDTVGGWSPNNVHKALVTDGLVAALQAAIDGPGVLQVVIYSSRQESGTEPTDAEYVYFGGYSDPAPPKLTITHHATSSSDEAPAELASATATAYQPSKGVAPVAPLISITASAFDADMSSDTVAGVATISVWASEGESVELDVESTEADVTVVANPAGTAIANAPVPSVSVTAQVATIRVRAFGPAQPEDDDEPPVRIPFSGSISFGDGGAIRFDGNVRVRTDG